MQLDGIPISDEQCIGESLPILNTSFQTLCAFANTSYSSIGALTDRMDLVEQAVGKSDRIINSQLRISDYGAVGVGLPPTGAEFFRVAGPAKFDSSILAVEAIVSGPTTLNNAVIRGNVTLSGDAIFGSGVNQNFNVNGVSRFEQNVGIKTAASPTNALTVNGTAVFTSISAVNYLGISNANISFDNVTQLKTVGSLATTSLTAGIGYQVPSQSVGTATRVNNFSTTGLLNYEITINSSCGKIMLPTSVFVSVTNPVYITVTNSTIKETDIIITNMKTSSLTYTTASVVGVSNGSFVIVLQSTGSNMGSTTYPRLEVLFARITTV